MFEDHVRTNNASDTAALFKRGGNNARTAGLQCEDTNNDSSSSPIQAEEAIQKYDDLDFATSNVYVQDPSPDTEAPVDFAASVHIPTTSFLPALPLNAQFSSSFSASDPLPSVPDQELFSSVIPNAEGSVGGLAPSNALAGPFANSFNSPAFDAIPPTAIPSTFNCASKPLNFVKTRSQVENSCLSHKPQDSSSYHPRGIGASEIESTMSREAIGSSAGIDKTTNLQELGLFQSLDTHFPNQSLPTQAGVSTLLPPAPVGVLGSDETEHCVPFSLLKSAINAALKVKEVPSNNTRDIMSLLADLSHKKQSKESVDTQQRTTNSSQDIIEMLEKITKEECANEEITMSKPGASTNSSALGASGVQSKTMQNNVRLKSAKRRRDPPVLPSEYVRSARGILEQEQNETPVPTLPSDFTKKRRTNSGAARKICHVRCPVNGTKVTSGTVQGDGAQGVSNRQRARESLKSLEERRRIRAERNRVSAMKSRERLNKKEMELERNVYYGRIENRILKRGAIKYRTFLRKAIVKMEQEIGREEAQRLCPVTYANLEHVEKVISECVWTFRPEDTPLIELKFKGDNKNEQNKQ